MERFLVDKWEYWCLSVIGPYSIEVVAFVFKAG